MFGCHLQDLFERNCTQLMLRRKGKTIQEDHAQPIIFILVMRRLIQIFNILADTTQALDRVPYPTGSGGFLKIELGNYNSCQIEKISPAAPNLQSRWYIKEHTRLRKKNTKMKMEIFVQI